MTPIHTYSSKPWRVVNWEGTFQVWTNHDYTAGNKNNYLIADGIQYESEANLLASAPDLLEALKSSLHWMQEYIPGEDQEANDLTNDLKTALAAIAKAKGTP